MNSYEEKANGNNEKTNIFIILKENVSQIIDYYRVETILNI